jgi:proteasome lid subunit RPN8/RPN11
LTIDEREAGSGERRTVHIRQDVLDAIVEHARQEAPNECCGLLAGSGGTIDECVRAANVKRSPTAYLIDPAGHFAALRRVRAEGRAILGAYHSHPRSAAVPSPTDIAEAHDAELVYVIVSLEQTPPDVQGYRIAEGSVGSVVLVSVPR